MDNIDIMIITGIATAALILIQARVTKAIQPVRLEMAELGEDLIDDPQLPSDMPRSIEVTLNLAYSSWVPVLVALLLPIACIFALFDRTLFEPDRPQITDKNLRTKLASFQTMSTLSILASNILIAPILIIEFVVFMVFLALFGFTFHALPRVIGRVLMIEDDVQHALRR